MPLAFNELQATQAALKISADSFPSVKTITNSKPLNSYIVRCCKILHGYNTGRNNKWWTNYSKMKAAISLSTWNCNSKAISLLDTNVDLSVIISILQMCIKNVIQIFKIIKEN